MMDSGVNTTEVTASDVVDAIRAVSTSERDKGDRFERLMQSAFRIDRTYQERFTKVWLWMEWPGRGNEPDVGIDLVAENRDGGFTAIQCKCYAPNHHLIKEDIDSFFTASGRVQFTDRIIVSTTDRWSKNAEKALEGQQIPVLRMGLDDLDALTVDWSKFDADRPTDLIESDRKVLRDHQRIAADKVRSGFAETERGQLIMACGTGKTFTALRIAEEHAGAGGAVLFLAPSIALVSQSLKEWTGECVVPIRPFAVCSDSTAGKPIEGENATPYDLPIPPTTSVEALVAGGAGLASDGELTVIFSTYQSVQVVADLQKQAGLRFDLVICDEAHRTATGSSDGDDMSAFFKVHDDSLIPADRRLYMTATPKVFKPAAREDAVDADMLLASMDDPETFGPEFHRLGFGEAVERGLLADYRVLILTVDEAAVSESFQTLLSSHGELNLPDVAKFIGCLTGIAKLPGKAGAGFTEADHPMQRAVAFWSSIEESQKFAEQFDLVAQFYNDERAAAGDDDHRAIRVPTRHVDGTDNIRSRREDLRWLKEEPAHGECRILTNAKCLTEGVDVPALDAVMFLKPRRSKIDIVQAVGRAMRKPPGKSIGYIILPIAVPAGQEPSTALNSNPDYDVVWDILQALRSHDERFNAYVNRIALRSEEPAADPDGPIAVIDGTPTELRDPDADGTVEPDEGESFIQPELFDFQEWTGAIYSKIVKKVGTRTYWEDWAADVVKIAGRHETRIEAILAHSPDVARSFSSFVAALHGILNDGITDDDAISMLSQHLITRPIFEALFGDDSFATKNPVSIAMQEMVDVLESHNLATETDQLEGFYDSVRRRVEGIPESDAGARQTIIKDLYGRFFKIAFPKMADSLGIVYTPVEVVDFIVWATEAALQQHFGGASLSDRGVHILDPFTGTGTFITRLLQSGYIEERDLARKFREEIHANEILLLAYYIAAINVESTYRTLSPSATYEPFPGIVLTDTFQLGETGAGASLDVFPVNNERAQRQRDLDIRVIVGNPPYSVGQSGADDGNPNQLYPELRERIRDTYVARSTAKQKRSLYDSYIQAIRWASDRILGSTGGGIVCFVTNGGYIDGNTADGLRLSLAEEFSEIYIYNLRGNQTVADWDREGGKIFDEGSTATIAVLLLVRAPESGRSATVKYLQTPDYASRSDKLGELAARTAVDPDGLEVIPWSELTPNSDGDWINQRSGRFGELPHLFADQGPDGFLKLRTTGLKTGRDAFNYSFSREDLMARATHMATFFNRESAKLKRAGIPAASDGATKKRLAREVLAVDSSSFSWTDKDVAAALRGDRYEVQPEQLRNAVYRPFCKQHVNFSKDMNNRFSETRRLFPDAASENLVICFPPPGSKAPPFSAFMVDSVFDSGLFASSATAGAALRVFDKGDAQRGLNSLDLGDADTPETSNVTRESLEAVREVASGAGEDDVFFYLYGVLHSPTYKHQFEIDLRKVLPRVPLPSHDEQFWGFSSAGRKLAALHTEYESLPSWPSVAIERSEDAERQPEAARRVEKMRYPRVSGKADKTRVVVNDYIVVSGIPTEAHDYRLGSRSALDWVVDSYRIKTDKKSGISNDPNDWADEQENETYVTDLIGQVTRVSMETLAVVAGLPQLDL